MSVMGDVLSLLWHSPVLRCVWKGVTGVHPHTNSQHAMHAISTRSSRTLARVSLQQGLRALRGSTLVLFLSEVSRGVADGSHHAWAVSTNSVTFGSRSTSIGSSSAKFDPDSKHIGRSRPNLNRSGPNLQRALLTLNQATQHTSTKICKPNKYATQEQRSITRFKRRRSTTRNCRGRVASRQSDSGTAADLGAGSEGGVAPSNGGLPTPLPTPTCARRGQRPTSLHCEARLGRHRSSVWGNLS